MLTRSLAHRGVAGSKQTANSKIRTSAHAGRAECFIAAVLAGGSVFWRVFSRQYLG
jgi:hypothetical protein